ncbi:MAG TPA: hypothetical protein VNO26_02920 [Candidatus Limnocylindria bacterium]|nr:hypothetical protein [Candidatus Limnocylindria bacterium]
MDARVRQAADIMARFAARTGLTAGGPARRYLWTDAFAVTNLLGLSQVTGESESGELALRLIDQVHHVLGRHRPDDARTGWLSGLDEAEGGAHPTRGGLRIGKPLPERPAGTPLDERREWDRDGPLVASMGQHDPVDGLVTCWQLAATARATGVAEPGLTAMAHDFASMVDRRGLATMDPLGLGGLLADAWRTDQLLRQGGLGDDEGLVGDLLRAAAAGLDAYARSPELRQRAVHRLAFRELGLAIGLAAVSSMHAAVRGEPHRALLERLAQFVPLRPAIEAFWLDPAHQGAESWTGHQDINDVMLATSLVPDGFLRLASPR